MSAAEPLWLRCSALPRAFACPPSVRDVDLRIASSSEPASLGSAVHVVMDDVVSKDIVAFRDLGDLAPIALRFGVDVKDLRPLVWYGVEAWKVLRETMPGARAEVALEASEDDITLSGHVDALAVSGKVAAAADWKSGRVDADHSAQVKGYAVLVFSEYPEVEVVHTAVVWLRDQTIENYTVTREQAMTFVDQLRQRVVAWDGRTYFPGPACTYCPRGHDCPAIVAATRRDIAILSASDAIDADAIDRGIAGLAPADVVALLRKAKAVEALAERVKDAVRRRVKVGGPLASGDGTELKMVATAGVREIDSLKAWPILTSALTDEELAGAITVHVGAVEAAVAKKAGRGKGAAAKRAINESLEAAGALARTPGEQMREIRIGTDNDKETP